MENSRHYGKNTIIHCFGGFAWNKCGRRQMQSNFLSVILKRKYFIYTLPLLPKKKQQQTFVRWSTETVLQTVRGKTRIASVMITILCVCVWNKSHGFFRRASFVNVLPGTKEPLLFNRTNGTKSNKSSLNRDFFLRWYADAFRWTCFCVWREGNFTFLVLNAPLSYFNATRFVCPLLIINFMQTI